VSRWLIALLALMASTQIAVAEKAGIGAWENANYTTLRWIEDTPGLDWYYNWRPDQMWQSGDPRRSVEFVPMIKDRDDIGKRIESDLHVRHLLGFNEPDRRDTPGADFIPVEEAARLWPKLERHGLRLGSPAATRGQTLGKSSWQRRFMDQVEARGLRVDFMAVHYYSTDGDIAAFRRWLTEVHREYDRPIWVTEFAFVDWSRPAQVSYAQNARFAEEAIRMMEELPFVERHAWFAANPYTFGGARPQVNLFDARMRPTPVGDAFRRVLTRLASRQVAGLETR